ncbi:MAG: hypothetical protein JST86_20215 [Bacteroidetes bacterium]|nr:hypothetical protein [Bacteroidota bacterium]
MKQFLLFILFGCCCSLYTKAQDITLSDSVIYFDSKPVAYFVKIDNESDPHYNVYIISLEKKLLFAAKVVKFDAPIRELKPFFYYDLINAVDNDTLAMYHEGQAFPLELAQLLKDYKLLNGNNVDRKAWRRFKLGYTGNYALKQKVKEYVDYLNEYRFLNEQTERDRTQPVVIVNDKIIMQDGRKIGLIVNETVTDVKGNTITYTAVKTRDNTNALDVNVKDNGQTVTQVTNILLPTNRVVNPSGVIIEPYTKNTKKKKTENLFDKSLPLNQSASNENILWTICQYVQNYLL